MKMKSKKIYFVDEQHKEAFLKLISRYSAKASSKDYLSAWYLLMAIADIRKISLNHIDETGIDFTMITQIKGLTPNQRILIDWAYSLFKWKAIVDLSDIVRFDLDIRRALIHAILIKAEV